MEDISEVYEKLSSTEQASLAEILFGKMRGNQGQALLQAFQSGQIQKAYETALSSAGSAAAEQEKWMEGLEAKAQRFKAAWQELSMTVLNSDFLKGLIDSGTVLLEILTKTVETGAAIPLLFGGVGIGNIDVEDAVKAMSSLGLSIDEIRDKVKYMGLDTEKAEAAIGLLGATGTKSMSSIGTAIKGFCHGCQR